MTARRLYDAGGAERYRTALILLDGAMELLLRRNVKEYDWLVGMADAAPGLNERAVSAGLQSLPIHYLQFPTEHVKSDFPDGRLIHLSAGQRKKLRDFWALIEHAIFFENIPRSYGRAIKELHEYRNGAYHRDEVEAGTVRTYVELYLFLIGEFLTSMRLMIGDALLLDHEESSSLRSRLGIRDDFELDLRGLAGMLVYDVSINPSNVSRVLSENLTLRLHAVRRGLQESYEGLGGSAVPDELFALSDVARLVQLSQPWPNAREARTRAVAVTTDVLDTWSTLANAVTFETDPLLALEKYAAIDRPLREFAVQVEDLRDELDRMVQREVDLRRGK